MVRRYIFLDRPCFSAKRAAIVAALALIPAATVAVFAATGLRINVSESLEDRFVKVTPIELAKRGDYVSFCRPLPVGRVLPGPCADGTMPLVKRVVAAAGDRVLFTPTELRVEVGGALGPARDVVVYRARYYKRDSLSNEMPHPTWGGYIYLFDHSVVVLGDHERSLDSRYFGVINPPDYEYKTAIIWPKGFFDHGK